MAWEAKGASPRRRLSRMHSSRYTRLSNASSGVAPRKGLSIITRRIISHDSRVGFWKAARMEDPDGLVGGEPTAQLITQKLKGITEIALHLFLPYIFYSFRFTPHGLP